MVIKFNDFKNNTTEMKNVFENIFSYDWIGYIEDLTIKINKCIEHNGNIYNNDMYIKYVKEYVNGLIKLICYNSDWEETNDYSDLFKFIYDKSHFMRAHNIDEQECINKIFKKINTICDKFGYEKIKDANGNII